MFNEKFKGIFLTCTLLAYVFLNWINKSILIDLVILLPFFHDKPILIFVFIHTLFNFDEFVLFLDQLTFVYFNNVP